VRGIHSAVVCLPTVIMRVDKDGVPLLAPEISVAEMWRRTAASRLEPGRRRVSLQWRYNARTQVSVRTGLSIRTPWLSLKWDSGRKRARAVFASWRPWARGARPLGPPSISFDAQGPRGPRLCTRTQSAAADAGDLTDCDAPSTANRGAGRAGRRWMYCRVRFFSGTRA